MKENRLIYPIKLMAKAFEVSRSGYYAWLTRKPSARVIADAQLTPLIVQIHKESRKTYGPRRMKDELAARGVHVGRERIGRIRKCEGICCVQKRKFKATTNSRHDLPTEPNLLAQGFSGHAPGEVWGTDITYISTGEGWLYLAGVKDFGSKEIVGWAMGERMTKELVCDALRKALAFHTPKPGCIHHSDKGVQYCSREYRADVAAAGFRVSMSRKGNCYDNAPTESLWGTLKQELVYHRNYATRADARASIQEYIEIFYNRVRRHSALGNMAPSIYAESYNEDKASA